jgi:acyl carrier protein
MKQLDIIEKTNGFLVEEFEIDPAKITPTANLKETLDLDSLDYIESKTGRFHRHCNFPGFL